MEISLANAKKLNWLWQDEHEIEWIETFVKIIDKSGKTVPFKLTPEQKAFINGLAHKNVISKSRQLGLSVCCAGISIRRCVCHPNTTCVLISHSQESTNKVFGKLKQMFYSLPDCIRPELLTNNRQELSFVNGSRISCQTAGNKDLCRGDTINGVLHMSEYAMWKNQEGQMQSLMQAVTESATCIIESTTKGFNSFTSTYMQARNGENDFKPFFFNWINGRTLFEPQYKLAVKSWKARHNSKMLTEDEYDEEEELIIKQADGTYIVDGMTQLEDLEELLGISFNEEDYDTINGYLIDCLDRIPSEDEECQVEFGGYLFHVLSVDNNTIRKVLVSRTKK